jgi:hypothetical protein
MLDQRNLWLHRAAASIAAVVRSACESGCDNAQRADQPD